MPTRPNIVLFFTDDHGAWALGCSGNRELRTPALDGLAANGLRFVNAFTPCPVCSPARACLMTGRTPSQVGIHDYISDHLPEYSEPDWLADEVTLPEILRAAGYHCGLSGKWHLGRPAVTPRGFDYYFGLSGGTGPHYGTVTYALNGQPVTLTGNKAEFITRQARDFLATAPADRPFFLCVGHTATHSPYHDHEPELLAEYADATFADIPPYVPHPWLKNEGFPNSPAPASEECVRRYRGYYAAVTSIDRSVAAVLDALRERGQLDNTLVLYTSDHGCALGHHGFWGKGNSTRPLNMYETSLRIPLIVHGPGVAPGVATECVDHYDTFQALCAVAGATPPARQHPGRSWWTRTDWRQTRYGEYGDLRMIRTATHKLVWRYPNGPHDLFDLQADPGETCRLPADGATFEALRAELAAFYAGHEDPAKSGLRVKQLRRHNLCEAWRDGLREARGLQVYA